MTQNELTNRIRLFLQQSKAAEYIAIEPGDISDTITATLTEFSRHIPYIVVTTFDGDGSSWYTMSDIYSSWADGCTLEYVEYPAEDLEDTNDRNILDPRAWEIVDSENGKLLHFRTCNPSSTETVRISIRKIHTVDTINDFDIPTFVYMVLEQLAMKYAAYYSFHKKGMGDIETSLDRATAWKDLAVYWRDKYRSLLGAYPEGMRPPPAAHVEPYTYVPQEGEQIDSEWNDTFLFHGARTL